MSLLGLDVGTTGCKAAGVLVRTGRTFHSRDLHRSEYEERYSVYRDLYPSLRGINHRLG